MPEAFVVDASAWLAGYLKEEDSEKILGFLEDPVCVFLAPELIRYETANAIILSKRFGRRECERLLETVRKYPFQIVPADVWWEDCVRLAFKHGLTFYDAVYAAIAVKLKCPLMTLDGDLRDIMEEEDIPSAPVF